MHHNNFGNFSRMKYMLFPFPLALFPFPFPSWAVWLFPFPWDSHGNGIPMGFPTPTHTSTAVIYSSQVTVTCTISRRFTVACTQYWNRSVFFCCGSHSTVWDIPVRPSKPLSIRSSRIFFFLGGGQMKWRRVVKDRSVDGGYTEVFLAGETERTVCGWAQRAEARDCANDSGQNVKRNENETADDLHWETVRQTCRFNLAHKLKKN